MIINAGIVRIVIRDGYSDKLAADMLTEAGVSVERPGKL
jgi:dCMP deaminase